MHSSEYKQASVLSSGSWGGLYDLEKNYQNLESSQTEAVHRALKLAVFLKV